MINYGIIGAGMMGQEHMKNIALLDGARVASIFEPDASMAEAALTLGPDVSRADSLMSLVEDDRIDCLVIASPNNCHAGQMREIADKRPLPLLVEKPLFTAPEDAEDLRSFRDRYAAPIWVAMEYRYMPPIAALLQEAPAATGGIRMLSIREHRFPFLQKVGDWNRFNRNTGGTFVEKCCHFFDLMRLALQSEPVRIMASGAMDVNHLDERYEGEKPDILDNGYVICDFANGARAMLELCMFAEGSRYQEEISAVGPLGKIEALVLGPRRFHTGPDMQSRLVISPRANAPVEDRDIPVDETLLEAGDHNGATFYQHQKFLNVVRDPAAGPEVSLVDGWAAVRMGQAAQRSIETGQSVTVNW